MFVFRRSLLVPTYKILRRGFRGFFRPLHICNHESPPLLSTSPIPPYQRLMNTAGEDGGPAQRRIVGLVRVGSFPHMLPDSIESPTFWDNQKAQG